MSGEEIELSDDGSDVKISDNLLCTYPPEGGIPMYFEDLACLKEEQWLNDQIISNIKCTAKTRQGFLLFILDFWLNILLYRLGDSIRRHILLFPSYFYKKLVEAPATSPYSKREAQHKRVA